MAKTVTLDGYLGKGQLEVTNDKVDAVVKDRQFIRLVVRDGKGGVQQITVDANEITAILALYKVRARR